MFVELAKQHGSMFAATHLISGIVWWQLFAKGQAKEICERSFEVTIYDEQHLRILAGEGKRRTRLNKTFGEHSRSR